MGARGTAGVTRRRRRSLTLAAATRSEEPVDAVRTVMVALFDAHDPVSAMYPTTCTSRARSAGAVPLVVMVAGLPPTGYQAALRRLADVQRSPARRHLDVGIFDSGRRSSCTLKLTWLQETRPQPDPKGPDMTAAHTRSPQWIKRAVIGTAVAVSGRRRYRRGGQRGARRCTPPNGQGAYRAGGAGGWEAGVRAKRHGLWRTGRSRPAHSRQLARTRTRGRI